jgi:hypothetical protein
VALGVMTHKKKQKKTLHKIRDRDKEGKIGENKNERCRKGAVRSRQIVTK